MGKVTVDGKGLVRIDGIPIFQRVVRRRGEVTLVVQDKANCQRTRQRGCRTVEVSLCEFVQAVSGLLSSDDIA